MYLVLTELRLRQFLPAQCADRLMDARRLMKKSPNNVNMKRKHDIMRKEAALILNEAKRKLRQEIEVLEKNNIQKHGFIHDQESDDDIEQKKKCINAINHYLYY